MLLLNFLIMNIDQPKKIVGKMFDVGTKIYSPRPFTLIHITEEKYEKQTDIIFDLFLLQIEKSILLDAATSLRV